MEKKIAIAVDDSPGSSDALSYAALLSAQIPDLHFVLLFIQPGLSLYLVEEAEKSAQARRTLDSLMKANHTAALQSLHKSRRRLTDLGVAGSRIESKTQPRMTGVAEDLLAICQLKSYDALLVARRGISRVQEWITGSVTTNLVENSKLTPIWVVDGQVSSADILLAADGSQGALRALDHLCFMLSGSDALKLRLLNVLPRFADECAVDDIHQTIRAEAEQIILSGHRRCMDDFFSQVLAVIEKYGIIKSRFDYQSETKTISTAHTLLQAIQKNGCGTIVLGRRGMSRSIFTGSVSRKVLQKVRHTAVWIVP